MPSTAVGSIHYDLSLDKRKFDGATREVNGKLSSLGSKFKSVAKGLAIAGVAMGATLAAVVGKLAIGGGISRALNIEDAQAKLKGLGHDAKSITKIMDSALKSVKGTAFGLDAAATAAASAVAAGIKPGKDLTRVLALTGDTATITGRQFNEAGSIINKVLASNRLSMQEVNQLSDAGLPILSMLGKEYGKTAAEMREMVSKGEVDSKKFLKALETNIAGAALASGETTRGAWENMKASMSRVGAAIVKDIIPRVRDSFGSMTKWFDDNSDRIVKSVGDVIEKFKDFVVVAKDIGSQAINIGKNVGKYLLPKLEALWNTLRSDVIPAVKEFSKELLGPLAGAAGKTLVVAIGAAIDILNVLGKIISPILRNVSGLKDVIIALAISFGGLKVIAVAQNMLTLFGSGLTAATIRTVGFKAALGSLASSINPVTAALAVAGLAYAAINKVVNEASNNLIKMNEAQSKAAEEAAKNAATKYQEAVKAYKDLVEIANQYLSINRQLTSAEEAVKVARDKLTKATQQYGEKSKQAKNAQAELSEQEAKLKQLHIDRTGELQKLVDKTVEMTGSTGALKNVTLQQLDADLAHARAIRDSARARGEDTRKIDGVISTLERLIKIKDVTINTRSDTRQATKQLRDLRSNILNIPSTRTIRFISDASRFRLPNVILNGWQGVPFKVPGKAAGGPVDRNKPYMVGEKGPELFVPNGSGKIIPNDQTKQMTSNSQVTNFYGPINNYRDADANNVLRLLSHNQELALGGSGIRK